MEIGRFSAFIGAVIWHPANGKYLLLKRSDRRDVGVGSWECVTGRVNQGECFTEAVHREVQEELETAVSIDFIIGTGHFYRGEAIPDNEMIGVLFHCSLENPQTITMSHEHCEMRWLKAAEAYELLTDDHWLYRAIERAEILRTRLPSSLLRFNKQYGFELN